MSSTSGVHDAPTLVAAISNAPSVPSLQRKCSCGAGAGASGSCAECDNQERFGTLQAKLTVSSPDDPLEKEADRVADEVMRMPEPARSGGVSQAGVLQREVDEPEQDEEELQTKPTSNARAPGFHAPDPGFRSSLAASGAHGLVLPTTTRSALEPRFGRDFSDVRVHHDAQSAELNRRVNARAFTHGKHIYFGAGQYDPGSSTGKRLLAHELTHTIQQRGAPGVASGPGASGKERK